MSVFLIMDAEHSEVMAEVESLELAKELLREWARLPWDQAPNKAPCTSWRSCSRKYEIVEFANPRPPYKVLRRVTLLEVSRAGARWADADRPLNEQ